LSVGSCDGRVDKEWSQDVMTIKVWKWSIEKEKYILHHGNELESVTFAEVKIIIVWLKLNDSNLSVVLIFKA
jgi:hypothetical protein